MIELTVQYIILLEAILLPRSCKKKIHFKCRLPFLLPNKWYESNKTLYHNVQNMLDEEEKKKTSAEDQKVADEMMDELEALLKPDSV